MSNLFCTRRFRILLGRRVHRYGREGMCRLCTFLQEARLARLFLFVKSIACFGIVCDIVAGNIPEMGAISQRADDGRCYGPV